MRSDQISRSLVSDSLRPHESQHTRPPSPSPTPGVPSDSRPLSQWCHPAISSSVVPFSSCPQSLPASESFPMSQLFSWGGQSTGVSTLASFLRKKSQGLSPSEWTGLLIHFHRQLIMWSTGYFVWIHSQTENCKKELQKKKGGGGQKDLIILDLSLFCGSLWFYLK